MLFHVGVYVSCYNNIQCLPTFVYFKPLMLRHHCANLCMCKEEAG